eukprot:TRINITY_DN10894_c0_g1_i1.p1 TRINITY_DN10894_c0_g1~~TRINITY_DN10894_c0_g1_i1.p1  ORF type:complete len:388 (+),score=26.01 TRINITY_DN10894_c0_g1_i1:249-1412(+)
MQLMEDEPGCVSLFSIVGSCYAFLSFNVPLRKCLNALISLDSGNENRLFELFSSCPNDFLDRLIRWAKSLDLKGWYVLCGVGRRPWDPTSLYFENATADTVIPEIFQTNSTPPASVDLARSKCFKVEPEASRDIDYLLFGRVKYPALYNGYYAIYIEGKLVRFGQLSSRYQHDVAEPILKWDGKILYSPNCGSHERIFLNHIGACLCGHCSAIAIWERLAVLDGPALPFSNLQITKALDSVLKRGRERLQPNVVVNVAREMHKLRSETVLDTKNYPNRLTEAEVYCIVISSEEMQSQPDAQQALAVACNNLAYLLSEEKLELPEGMRNRNPTWKSIELLEMALKFWPDMWEARYNMANFAANEEERESLRKESGAPLWEFSGPWVYK